MRFLYPFILLLLFSCSGPSKRTLSKECSQNNVKACYSLGLKEYESGEKQLASLYFEKGCRLGHNKSCDYYLTRNVKKSRIDESLSYYERECSRTNIYSCTVLGRIHYNLGNKDKGRQYYIKACDKGDPSACAFMGHQVSARDQMEEEFKYFERACALETESRGKKKNPLYCLLAGNAFAKYQKPSSAGRYYEMACLYEYHNDETELYKKLGCSRSGVYLNNEDYLTIGVGYLKSKCFSQEQKESYKDCYDLAALHSIQKNPGMSLKYFERSLKLGNTNWKHFFDDHELEFLRSIPLFRPMVYKYYRDYRTRQK